MVILATLFRRCSTLKKSTLQMTTLFRRCLTLFSSFLKRTTMIQRVRRCNFNVGIHNVVSTLIWRCAASWRHINLKTTLKRWWNICWTDISFSIDLFSRALHFLVKSSNLSPWDFSYPSICEVKYMRSFIKVVIWGYFQFQSRMSYCVSNYENSWLYWLIYCSFAFSEMIPYFSTFNLLDIRNKYLQTKKMGTRNTLIITSHEHLSA